MDRIVAPYNFVPFANRVHFPKWGPSAAQDIPFEHGLSGTLELAIETETPLFIRGERPESGVLSPWTHDPATAKAAIPGTSLRGLLRNVVEIATFGRLGRVNDSRYGVRDLHNRDLYGRHMAEIRNGQPTPLVTAGWLKLEDGALEDGNPDDTVAWIEPCNFAKVEYRKLLAWARDVKGVRNFTPGARISAPAKYAQLGGVDACKGVRATVKVIRDVRAGDRWRGDYGVAESFGTVGTHVGQLVLTGQPSEWSPDRAPRRGGGHPKHHDFFFYPPPKPVDDPAAKRLPILRRTLRDFAFVHSDRGQQDRATDSPNAEWKLWSEPARRGERVPVFFLMDAANIGVRAFGLAMMFRLAYDTSVRESIAAHQTGLDDPRPDFAETLFGDVPLRDSSDGVGTARKGRVSIGLARPTAPLTLLEPVKAVLGAPRASYYPNYIEQTFQNRTYRSFMRDGKEGKDIPRIRGWKRYRPFPDVLAAHIPAKSSDRVATVFQPVAAGAAFQARVRVHNVLPAELGALLWALDFGDPEGGCRHTLGMARSLGYGRVRLRLVGAEVRDMKGARLDDAAVRGTVAAFVEHMEQVAREHQVQGGWALSEVIWQLRACARPFERPADGRHMRLDHPERGNEFVEAKKGLMRLEPAGSPVKWQQAIAELQNRAAQEAAAREAARPAGERLDALHARLPVARRATLLQALEEWMLGKGDEARRLFPEVRALVDGDPGFLDASARAACYRLVRERVTTWKRKASPRHEALYAAVEAWGVLPASVAAPAAVSRGIFGTATLNVEAFPASAIPSLMRQLLAKRHDEDTVMRALAHLQVLGATAGQIEQVRKHYGLG